MTLATELQELNNKIDSLKEHTRLVGDSVLPMNEQDLIQYQHQCMCDYARILRERIALFTNQTGAAQ